LFFFFFLCLYCWWRHFLRLVEFLHKQSCSLACASTRLCTSFILPIFYLQWISVLVIAKIQFCVLATLIGLRLMILFCRSPVRSARTVPTPRVGLATRVFLLSVLLPAPTILLGPAPVCHRRSRSASLWPVFGVESAFRQRAA
jgi:hypothetical protein